MCDASYIAIFSGKLCRYAVELYIMYLKDASCDKNRRLELGVLYLVDYQAPQQFCMF